MKKRASPGRGSSERIFPAHIRQPGGSVLLARDFSRLLRQGSAKNAGAAFRFCAIQQAVRTPDGVMNVPVMSDKNKPG